MNYETNTRAVTKTGLHMKILCPVVVQTRFFWLLKEVLLIISLDSKCIRQFFLLKKNSLVRGASLVCLKNLFSLPKNLYRWLV